MNTSSIETAFVAGATGFTGREVVRQLRERGIRVIAHIRPGSGSAARWVEQFRAWGAEVVEVPWEPEAMRAAIGEAKPALVYCLIGTTRSLAKREKLEAEDIYDAVDRRLTALLVEAVVEAKVRPRFVYLSSVGADPEARGAYLAARGRAEAAVTGSGLPYTIARPSIISGPGRDEPRPAEHAAEVLLDGGLGLLGALGAKKLQGRYRSISDVALAKALVHAGTDPAFEGKVLHGEELQRLSG